MRTITAAVLILLTTPAHAQENPPPAMAATLPEIDATFESFARESHAPGLVYGIVAGGKLAHVKTIGVQDIVTKRPVTATTRFRIASMSKAFTALAILKLRDDGRLALDDLAEKHVPELRGWRYPTSDAPRISVRDLLSHVGGFVTDDPWGDRQQVMAEADFTALLKQGVPFSRTPQTGYEYSNFGYALLGRITNVSGKPYDVYIGETILKPLGMADSGYEYRDVPPEKRAIGYRWEDGVWKEEPTMKHGAFGAMGGLYTTANDYARFVAWLLQGWPARDGPQAGPLARASIRELAQGQNFVRLANRRGKSGATACKLPTAYGKGMIAAQDCDLGLTLAHGGGFPGYGSHVMLMPDTGTAIFAFTNRTYGGPSGPAWDGAVALHKAGALTPAARVVSAMLTKGYAQAGAMFTRGDVRTEPEAIAMNMLMDRDAAHWADDLAKVKAKVGDCDVASPITPTGAMSGRFEWTCSKGKVAGTILLAPTTPVTIQALEFQAE
jgi:serine-type D-Ala-D-Ala carboxypeptidase/endopeptidase